MTEHSATAYIESLERKARIAGVTIKDATARANIAESTFHRWKNEPPHSLKACQKISEAIDLIAAEKEAK